MNPHRALGYAAQFVPGTDIAHAGYMKYQSGGSIDDHYAKTKAAKAGQGARGAMHGAVIGGLMGAGAGVLSAASGMKRGGGRAAMKDAKRKAIRFGATMAALGAGAGHVIGGASSNAGHYQKTLESVRHTSNDSVNVKEASVLNFLSKPKAPPQPKPPEQSRFNSALKGVSKGGMLGPIGAVAGGIHGALTHKKEASGHALLQKLPMDSKIGPNPPSPAEKLWDLHRKARNIKNG